MQKVWGFVVLNKTRVNAVGMNCGFIVLLLYFRLGNLIDY